MRISVLNSRPFLSSSWSYLHKHNAPKADPEPEDRVLRLLGAPSKPRVVCACVTKGVQKQLCHRGWFRMQSEDLIRLRD